MHTCKDCKRNLPKSCFDVDERMAKGHVNQCQECRRAAKRDHYHKTKDLASRRIANLSESEIEKKRAQSKQFHNKHRESELERKKRYRNANPDKYREWNTRRRALRLGNGWEKYERSDIYERDGWNCQLCQEAVDPILEWPEPWSRSIDHIVPLSKGGPDTPDNVQLAHLHCNLSKHAKQGNDNGA